jgi:hypothetical protein
MVPVLLLGFGVLLHDVDHTSLWADEGWTIAATGEDNPLDVIDEWVVEDVHPPLYFILLNIWRQFTGDTIFEMRYFAVLVSLTGMAVMFRLSQALFSLRAGVLAALLFGLHDLVNVLTQEVRHYSLQLTLSATAIWLYWRFWQRPTRWRGLAFAVAGAALIWTHYWGGFILLGLGLHAVLTRWKIPAQILPFIYAYLGIGLLFSPWLPSLYGQITEERPEGLPHALENSPEVYETLVYQLAGVPEALWIVLAVVGTFGAFIAVHRQFWPTSASILPALLIVLTVGLSLLLNTRYETLSFRSLAVIIPPLLVAVSHALAQFRWRELTVVVVFIVIHALTTTSAQPVPRPPWPEYAETLLRYSTPEELILLELGTDDYAVVYYLDQSGEDINYVFTETPRKEINDQDEFTTYLAQEVEGYQNIWVAKFDWPFYDIGSDLRQWGYVRTLPELIFAWPPYDDGRPIQVWRLDQAEDVQPRTTFDEILKLMHYSIEKENDGVRVNLIWSPTETPPENYTVSVFLLQPGVPVQNDDSYPLEGRELTTTWQPGEFYFDTHFVPFEGLPPGEASLGVKVYYFTDANPQDFVDTRASDCSDDPTNCSFIFIDTITVP